MIDKQIIHKLKEKFGTDNVKTEDFNLMPYSRDWSPRPKDDTHMPDVVIKPTSTEEVSEILKIANANIIPVTPIAGLTGMGGGAVPVNGGIALETKALNKIIEIDEKNYTVTTQTGITVLKLNEELRKCGLWWPHDPESKPSSTVGAAISCDNDSTFGIKYGRSVDFLLNAVVVTGTGEILRVGHRKALCTSTGYKLHWLLIGAEGTLGIITEATFNIFKIPESRWIDGYLFRSIQDALDGLNELVKSGLSIESAHINCQSRLGFYTQAYREKFGRDPNIPDWAKSILFVSFNGDKEVVDFSKKYAKKILSNGKIVEEREIIDSWWTSKHTLSLIPFVQKWPESQKVKKFGSADLGIPIGRIQDAYGEYQNIAEKHGIEILGMCVYNERPNRISPSISFAVFVDDSEPEKVRDFYDYVKEMSQMAIEKEGTMSTYIGDGDRLGGFNRLEHGKSLDYMFEIKKIFDPNNILQPGKKFKSQWIDY
ncbi:MAG: FAD-binding protein [Candidatus Lokiarchaeota archaeon]|nr:FAD-binding protein [Candidatus Lokiarchaeota archaeon]